MWYKLLIIFTYWLVYNCLITRQDFIVVFTLIVFLATCGSFVFVILSSVSLDVVKVVIPSCAFCIQMKILCKAHLVGELASYDPYQVCVIGRHIYSLCCFMSS